MFAVCLFFFFQAEDGIRDLVRSRGLGDVYKRQQRDAARAPVDQPRRRAEQEYRPRRPGPVPAAAGLQRLSLIHI